MTSTRPAPSSRRGRPAVIDRESVIDAALAVIEREGADRLTMKGLSAELGVSTMAAYRHISDKQSLMELVVQRVLDADSPAVDGPWADRLWALLWTRFSRLSDYPGLVDYLYRNPRTRHGRHLMGEAVDVLLADGFEIDEAKLIVSDVYAYLSGRVLFHARAAQSGATTRSGSTRNVPTLGDLASDAHIRHGYDALIAGLTRSGLRPGADLGH